MYARVFVYVCERECMFSCAFACLCIHTYVSMCACIWRHIVVLHATTPEDNLSVSSVSLAEWSACVYMCTCASMCACVPGAKVWCYMRIRQRMTAAWHLCRGQDGRRRANDRTRHQILPLYCFFEGSFFFGELNFRALQQSNPSALGTEARVSSGLDPELDKKEGGRGGRLREKMREGERERGRERERKGERARAGERGNEKRACIRARERKRAQEKGKGHARKKESEKER